MELVFASHNLYKVNEISQILPSHFKIKSLLDLKIKDIPETGNTLEENALIKAKFVNQNFQINAFADDSGLEVEALNSEPGVYSARYAGEPKNDLNNMLKLLDNLKDKTNRNAQFKTIIALIIENKEYLFEGIIKGKIITEMRGENGFGYDPIFILDGYEKTFAEMNADEKNKISHRAIAVNKMVEFLNNYK